MPLYDETSGETPRMFSLTRRYDVPHYYGDHVRLLFLLTALVSLVAIPVFGDLLPFGSLIEVASAILLVLLAGLTNPRGRMVTFYNMLVSGLGLFFLESAAISFYNVQSTGIFLAREAAAVMLLIAFYFSVKTFRAISQGKLGVHDRPFELEEKNAEE